MPTTAERNALIFLAAVAVVGSGARVMSASRFEQAVGAATVSASGIGAGRAGAGPGAFDNEVTRQIAAVDSARAARSAKASKASRSRAAKKPRTSADAAGPTSITSPAPRARSSARLPKPTLSQSDMSESPSPIDVNSATAEELQRLPRVGPAIAARIIEYREQHGVLSDIDDLRHIRGIGVTTAARLAPLVTFSGGYRLSRSEARRSSRDRIPPYD